MGSNNPDPRSERLNGETAVVFEKPVLAEQLCRNFMAQDLDYSRRVTPEMAAGFASPEDVIERFRRPIGHLFEDEL
ncbi:MAG: hypothetical protein P8080_04040 [Gammaproteobacteria bacterium]